MKMKTYRVFDIDVTGPDGSQGRIDCSEVEDQQAYNPGDAIEKIVQETLPELDRQRSKQEACVMNVTDGIMMLCRVERENCED